MTIRTLMALLTLWASVTIPCLAIDRDTTLSLDGTWSFKWVPDAKAADPYRWFFEDGFDDSDWDQIPVPSHWALLGYEDPTWVDGTPAEGFYFRRFTLPESKEKQRIVLHFDGVWVSAEVWVNGQAQGRHDSGFTAFAFDITNAVKPGQENLLAVRVRQQIPALQYKFDANDDWALAGIYRSVWIETMPLDMYIADVEVTTDFDRLYQDATLQTRVFINRYSDEDYFDVSDPFEVRAILRDANNVEVTRKSHTATINNAHNGNDYTLAMRVERPKHWTAETPNLYNLTIELIRDGNVTHQWQDNVGFREISTDGGVLRINGQAVKLRGVNRHDQHPDVGRVTQHEHWLQDIQLMKAANINAVRCSHYPPAEGFIRLCDEMGLYVVDEIPLGFAGERMMNPIFTAGMMLRIQETIQRDRNRPSVIVWSFGNEDPFTALHLDGLKAIKGLDSTRPTLLPFRAELDLPKEVDILAPHYWFAEENDKLAAASTRPIITTEFTHAMGQRDFGEFEQRWKALIQHPTGAGGMIWLWADQGLKRPINGRPVYHPMDDKDKYERKDGKLVRESSAGPGYIYDTHGNWGADGIVNADRSAQRDYWEAKAVYAPIEVVTPQVSFAPGQEKVFMDIRNGYDFLDLSAFTLDWKLFRNNEIIASEQTKLPAPPHTTTTLAIPTTAIQTGDTDAVYYVHLTSLRQDGSQINTESIRLGDSLPPEPKGVTPTQIQVIEQDNLIQVKVGAIVYRFDPSSGQIAGIDINQTPITAGANLVTWRPATYCERNRLDNREHQHNWNTYMQGLTGQAQSWQLSESPDGVTITTDTLYQADDLNQIQARFVYHITAHGGLKVSLAIQPQLDVPEIPEIGLEFQLPQIPHRLQWLGEGPLDSKPGKAEATYFGWWEVWAKGLESNGTKSGIEWAQLLTNNHTGLHIKDCAGFRYTDNHLRVFTHLAAPWCKNGPPEREEWQLTLGDEVEFQGSFEIIPLEMK